MARANLLTRLLILVAVATAPAILVLVYLQFDLHADRRARLAGDALRQAELLNADVGNIVEGARQLMLALIHSARIERLDPLCREQLREVRRDAPSYDRLLVISAAASTICSSDDAPSDTPPPALAALAGETMRRARFSTGVFEPPSAGHAAQLPFAMPFQTPDGTPAVVVASLSLDWLQHHLDDFQRPPRGAITVADRDGIALARVPEGDGYVGHELPEMARGLIDAPARGSAMAQGFDGLNRMTGYVPIGESPIGLFVSVGYFLPDMMPDIDRAARRGYLMIAAGAVFAFALTLLVAHYFIRRPTRILVEAARRWSGGDVTARVRLREAPTTEFGRLAVALNAMAEAFHRQRAQLRELNTTLEQRVAERTGDLVESRNRLQVEVAEHEKTEASLQQARKLQAIGQLAGGIAHDFNNMLTAVTGALELLRRRMPEGHDGLVRLADDALLAAERGARLTTQLLAFARRQRLLPAPTDLNAVLVSLTSLLGSTLGRSVRITTALAPDLWPAMVDPAQVESAVLNLALNARDSMPRGGVLTIATANVTLDGSSGVGEAHPIAPGDHVPGDFVAVCVTDTGVGMSAEILHRVFEPFFTTKEPGQGSGLGLSQVHGLAVQSGGDVRIESHEGEGTRVTLLLPRAHLPAAAAPPGAVVERRGGHRDVRILVVDDDDDVRAMVGEMLREAGYSVTLVGGAAEALAFLDRDAAFALLLADYAMPGQNGLTLIEAVGERHPAIRALLVTGYAEFDAAEGFPAEWIVRKPFTIRALIARVEQALAGARETADSSPAGR